MRCAAIDGRRFLNGEKVDTEKIGKAAEGIFEFRSILENPAIAKGRLLRKKQKCATVLILWDNASNIIARILAAKLEELTRKNEIASDAPLFVLIYICSSVDFQAIPNSDDEVGAYAVTSDDCQILQKLDDNEIRMFQARLKSLIAENCNVEDMMSFVIMAENFNQDSEYVERVVKVGLQCDTLFSGFNS